MEWTCGTAGLARVVARKGVAAEWAKHGTALTDVSLQLCPHSCPHSSPQAYLARWRGGVPVVSTVGAHHRAIAAVRGWPGCVTDRFGCDGGRLRSNEVDGVTKCVGRQDTCGS